MNRNCCRALLPVLLGLLLLGCAGGSSLLSDVVAGVASERLGSRGGTVDSAPLNPAYRYLRVEVAGRPPALLVLGYLDAHPQGEIEVWYSARGEVIKLQGGRIVATAGLETDWRAVRFVQAPPPWLEALDHSATFERARDVMPGHRYGIRERVSLRAWRGSPPAGLPAVLAPTSGAALQWFQETTPESAQPPLPPAWYAVGIRDGRRSVVYSEQCLSPALCLRFAKWPVQVGL